MMMQA